ncbi:cytochrome c biogenesis protein CcdA [Leptospira perolatii]|nr:cytochrome c biogenesis protein CcdA [Leptospira perolatii]
MSKLNRLPFNRLVYIPLITLFPFSLFAESLPAPEGIFAGLHRFVENGLSVSEFNAQVGLLLFTGGFLASLLPCVYPLYPITVGIIQGRGVSDNRLLHPLIYYFGLAFMYFCFGTIAGISGGAFNSVLRYPFTNFFLSILIFLLGLTSVGVLHLPIFRGKESIHSKGWKGTFALGMGAGLLSSPCVGPIVVTILIQVTAVAGTVSFASIGFASLKMLLFGLGLGFPFLLIGVFGLSLPRSGKWLKWVQWALGCLVFYFSWIYYIKAMDAWGIPESVSVSIAAAAIAILIFSYLLQNSNLHVTERMKKALLITGLIASSAILIRLAVSFPGEISESTSTDIESHANLSWHRNPIVAFREARDSQKILFADFSADWCTNCKAFDELSIANLDLNRALGDAVLLKIKDEDDAFAKFQEDPRFPELKIGLPFFVIFSADGKVLFKTTNYLNTMDMIRTLKGESIQSMSESAINNY